MCVFNNIKIEIHNNKKKGLTKSLKPIEKTPFKKRRKEEEKKRRKELAKDTKNTLKKFTLFYQKRRHLKDALVFSFLTFYPFYPYPDT